MARIIIPTVEQTPAAARHLHEAAYRQSGFQTLIPGRGENMSKKGITKIGSFLAAAMLVTSLVGCAASQGEMPLANGYDFQVPNDGGG